MKLYNAKQEEGDAIPLKINQLNVITQTHGHLILPKCSRLSQIKCLFSESGAFSARSEEKDVLIYCGNMSADFIELRPGEQGFDTQPLFVFIPHKKSWLVVTGGLIVFPDKEESSENN